MNIVEQFELFVTRVDELLDTRLIKTAPHKGFSMSWSRDTGLLEMTPSQVDEDDLRSLLLIFRHFTADKEPVFLSRIYNLCNYHINSDELRKELREAAKHWRNLFRSA